ncbi:hypothetical protein CAC42_4104 [Sphaceloma murrayae]|uniref:Rhodopsin domain-containing protein n=1 Tax=Sphaceloma murrayae TaxID=2082308 RepID=A0A2K1QL27_9PEZI|nr:hypothetical protein CAC42_4104 [Sphaceloma murrayae]
MALVLDGGRGFGRGAVTLVIVAFIEAALAISLVTLRFFKTRNKRFKWDLFWVVLATLGGVVLQVLGLFATLNGLGKSKTELSPAQVTLALKWTWIGFGIGVFALTTGKLAIIALYLQVAQAAARRERYFLWIMTMVVVASAIGQITLLYMQCDPLPRLWSKEIPGSCAGVLVSTRFGYFQGAFSAFTDFALALYPITIIWNMTGSRATRIGICAVMAGGLLPFTAAIGRVVHLKTLEQLHDPTKQLVPLCIWAITEQWFVIILGCLPPLRSYFARYFNGLASPVASVRLPADVPDPRYVGNGSAASDLSFRTIDLAPDSPKAPASLVAIVETKEDCESEGQEGQRDLEKAI